MAKAKNTTGTTTTPAAVVAPTVAPATVDLANMDIVGGLGGIATATPAVATNKKPKVPGVAANTRTRAYHAGCVVAQHGHANGIVPGMITQVNEAYGDQNDIESGICLRNAWHAIRGFLAVSGTPVPPAPKAE